jgi:hypothetical protein
MVQEVDNHSPWLGHYERKVSCLDETKTGTSLILAPQMKHLEKQKRGKAKLKRLGIGNIDIPQSAFYEILSSRPSKV